MSIWRLPDGKLGSASGVGEVPEIAVIHREMFRSFTLGSGSTVYPYAFRSDTRPLEEIARTGFQPRSTVLAKYDVVNVGLETHRRLRQVRAALAEKFAADEEGERTRKITEYLSSMVAVRMGNVDLDNDCAVCFTRDYKIAGLFPYDPMKPELLKERARVYIVRLKGWLETYRMQAYLAPHLAYSKEVATLGVPVSDVLGCVYVDRELKGGHVVLRKGGSEQIGEGEEPGEDGSDLNAFEKIVASLPDETTVALPAQKDSSSLMLLPAKKFEHIKKALEGLTGKTVSGFRGGDDNVIRDGKLTELPDYKPPAEGQQRVVSPY
ncbi:hypothetical protein [Hamadaea tsunoensis]|uniref:hypothetical protein n=1 Tax=Hamadaea tsunoensis TaxID=53368 RepID=UPI000402C3F5|nr:hypothetical protein [Hamadaea tsunoensis]